MVWLRPPWKISSHRNITEHEAGKRYTQEQQPGSYPRVVPIGSSEWGHPSAQVIPCVGALKPPEQAEACLAANFS